MRIAPCSGAAVLSLLLAAAAAPAAGARFPAALGTEGRVFTLAGGGDERAREGLPAHRVRLKVATPAALPDGDVALLAAPGSRIGERGGFGAGDGGYATEADLFALDVDAGADGTVVVGDWPLHGFTSADRGVIDPFLARVFLARPGRPAVRAFVPPGTGRPLAALAPPTFRTLPAGEVVVRTTLAGRATVVVREAGREVARASADVPAGRSTLRLDRNVPDADLSLTLDVDGADAVAGGRLEVSTLRRLGLARARAAAQRIDTPLSLATSMETGWCRRASARRVACAMVRSSGRCGGRIVVRQRADGRRLTLQRGRRLCPGA